MTKPVKIKHSEKISYEGQLTSLSPYPIAKEKNENSNFAQTATWVAGVALATGALTYSRPARANIDGILNDLVSYAQNMLEPLLEGTFGGFGSLINGGSSDASSAVVQAIGTSSDGIIEANKEIANNKIALASMPPPCFCESDEIGQASYVLNKSAGKTLTDLVTSSAQVHNAADNQLYATKVSTIASRYSSNSGKKNKHIEMSNYVNQSKISDESDVKAYVDAVDAMSVEATSRIKLNDHSAISDSGRRQAFYVVESGKAARLELAKGVLYDSLADRVVAESGESKMSLLDKEIDRTYGGNSTWRSELLDYADPTPLLAELNKQQSLTNYMLLELLKKTSKQNAVIASQALKSN